MPTDEQRMREQFEADAKEALHWSTVSFDREELRPDEYAHGPMQYRWLGWQAAHRSRDAEVQALREALGRLLVATDQIERYDDTTDLIAAADRALW